MKPQGDEARAIPGRRLRARWLRWTRMAAVGLLFTGGCNAPLPLVTMEPAEPQPSFVEQQLAKFAERSTRAMERLSQIQEARTPQIEKASLPANLPRGLKRKVDLDAVAPVHMIAADLARRADFGFEVLGKEPTSPVMVDVGVTQQSVVDVLRSIGLQAGTRADVVVDMADRRVLVEYVGRRGSHDAQVAQPGDVGEGSGS